MVTIVLSYKESQTHSTVEADAQQHVSDHYGIEIYDETSGNYKYDLSVSCEQHNELHTYTVEIGIPEEDLI